MNGSLVKENLETLVSAEAQKLHSPEQGTIAAASEIKRLRKANENLRRKLNNARDTMVFAHALLTRSVPSSYKKGHSIYDAMRKIIDDPEI